MGTDRGENYQQLLAHHGEGSHEDPGIYERRLGDLLDPSRPGRMVDVVNAVTRETGIDATEWGVERLLGMVMQVEQEPRPDV